MFDSKKSTQMNFIHKPRRLGMSQHICMVVAFGLLVNTYSLPANDAIQRSPKQQMLQLLQALHSTDSKEVGEARSELRKLGVSNDQIEIGKMLVAKDAKTRIDLAKRLKSADKALQTELLVELSKDRDKVVRTAALETVKQIKPGDSLRTRIAEMAKADPDAIVRGHARLLDAEWKFGANRSTSAVVNAVSQRPKSTTPTRQAPATIKTANRKITIQPRELPASAKAKPPEAIANKTTTKTKAPWADSKPTKLGAVPKSDPFPTEDIADLVKTPAQTAKETKLQGPPTFQEFSEGDSIVHSHHKEMTGPGAFPTTDEIEHVGLEVEVGPSSSVPSFDPVGKYESIQKGPKPLLLDLPIAEKPVAETAIPTTIPESNNQVLQVGLPPLPSEAAAILSEQTMAALQQPADPNRVIERPIGRDAINGPRPMMEGVNAYNYDEKVAELTQNSDFVLQYPEYATFGYSGGRSQLPTEVQTNSHFVPIEDRWRIGNPYWDRYGNGHPGIDDYPGVEGHWWDPYNQNVLKGDFPIIGQHTFLNVTGTSLTVFDYRETPIPTTPFESTLDPFQEEFFGDPAQFFFTQFFRARFDLFHANDAAFKPLDWQVRLTPVYNVNYLDVRELGITRPDVRQGTNRQRDDKSLEEWFGEVKLADISPDYDFISVRAGSQFFTSDFRGHIFFDTNRGVRLFGSRFSNRDQFNVVWFDQAEKNTNSGLNTADDRHQNVVIANYYRQDFLFPGYTAQVSYHYNHDQPSREFDRNDFLVRPDPAGVFRPHEVKAHYLGFAGNGHVGRYNIDHAFYYVFGEDSLNPIGGRELDISAMMAAVELSYDRDWARFRTSLFWASGDDDPTDTKGEGFDTILDNPVFTGEFSYWSRQRIGLFGVGLVQDRSLVPSLRSSKLQGQSNFTNPGVLIVNTGFDADITPKLKLITNMNYLWFDQTEVLEAFTFQGNIEREIGLDLSMGYEYRPFHNDNVIVLVGASALAPGNGFKDLYNQFGRKIKTLYTSTLEVILTF